MPWLMSPLFGYKFCHLAKVLATTNFEPDKPCFYMEIKLEIFFRLSSLETILNKMSNSVFIIT